MKLEIRKSGGDTCEGCGATELVVSGRTSEALQRDLAPLIAQELLHFEQELVRVAQERQEEIVRAAEGRYQELQDGYEQKLAEVFAEHAPQFNPWRRRFHDRVQEALGSAFSELTSETKY